MNLNLNIMKTQLRNRSLRNLVVSAIVAASLNVAVYAQPNPDRSSMTLSYSERLEMIMEQTEQSLKYTAPEGQSMMLEQEAALQNLEMFSMDAENMLKYKAPVELEDQIDQELELLANSMMEQLEYRAPVYDEFTNTFAGIQEMAPLKVNTRPVLADECTPQEAWLIKAGYYKSSKKSLLQKARHEELKNDKFADKL